MTEKDEFSNASRQQQSPVQTANIASKRSKRRVQCTGLGVHSGRTYSTRKSIFKNNPNENFGQETRPMILISLYDVYHSKILRFKLYILKRNIHIMYTINCTQFKNRSIQISSSIAFILQKYKEFNLTKSLV